jgi:hypothetical protein
MPKNSPQGRRQASTHYHDAARQHQEAAHYAKAVVTRDRRTAQATRTSTGNSGRKTQAKR